MTSIIRSPTFLNISSATPEPYCPIVIGNDKALRQMIVGNESFTRLLASLGFHVEEYRNFDDVPFFTKLYIFLSRINDIYQLESHNELLNKMADPQSLLSFLLRANQIQKVSNVSMRYFTNCPSV